MVNDGVYTIPDISGYSEVGFILYGTYGCSQFVVYPVDILLTLNGRNDLQAYNRPLISAIQTMYNGISILISIPSSTSIRCDSINTIGPWYFTKLEIYAR